MTIQIELTIKKKLNWKKKKKNRRLVLKTWDDDKNIKRADDKI